MRRARIDNTPYYVSEDGIVWGSNENDIYPLTPRVSHRGYARVRLQINGKGKEMSVHRLVALAFISNPDNLETVNHIDKDKLNNNADNLEWLTRGDNIRHWHNSGNNC